MCGIAGIWNIDGKQVTYEQLYRFTDSLSHRGPDGYGYELFDERRLGFGHRRLSILDLSETGKQPMSYGDGRYWITYNGEIFNFIELRNELESYGYTFRSQSDTEVILASYDKWGKGCLLKFNGMWAFAIWDKKNKQLFLARDRWGIKPLYYTFENQLFAFASETYSFGYLDGFNKEIDSGNLLRALHSFNVFEASGYTLYRNILQLLPGYFMIISSSGKMVQKRWWNTLHHLQKVPKKFEQQVEMFLYLFEDSCKLRLRSDVPVASALSGGIDSSSVYCTLQMMRKKVINSQRLASSWHKAFVATFPGCDNDERKYAEEVIRHTSGEVKYIVPDETKLADQLIRSTYLSDCISGTPLTCLTPLYKAMREDGIVVSMDGHGADEMMFGYTSGVAEAYVHAYANNSSEASDYLSIYEEMYAPHEGKSPSEKLYERAQKARLYYRETWKSSIRKSIKKMLKIRQYYSKFPGYDSDGWYFNRSVTELDFNETDPYDFSRIPLVQSELWRQFHYTDLPYILRNFDRGAMQHGIEIRMPFMDWRLVTFVFSLPVKSRLGHGFTKRILREAMKGMMPESIRTRKLKIGFSSSIVQWFNGPLSDFLADTCSSKHFKEQPYWNGTLVANEVNDRCRLKSWDNESARKFWLILNAFLLIEGK